MSEVNYREKFKIIAAIADIHIGNKAISHEEYKYQIKNGVIKKLEKMTMLDGIVICGDTLHYQLSLNSGYANVYFWFISKIIKIAKKHSAFVRIIKGTKSHDLFQLDNIKYYEDDSEIDFKVIDNFYTEEIDGHRYAYIPEEYVDKYEVNDYYADILCCKDNYYDMIFGHGTVSEFSMFEQEGENITTKAPIFNTDNLMRICKGPILFGHIHRPTNIRDKFFYVGSTLRTCHGEEHDKGWNVICYIQESGVYRVDKIINEFTFNFNTLKLDNMFIGQHDAEDIIRHIESFVEKNNTDKLSLKINCVENKDTLVKIQLLKKYLQKDKNITTHFKIMSQKAYERDREITKNKEKKPYLQDGLDVIQQIKLWALDKRNIRLEDDDIQKFITTNNLKRKGV